MSRESVRDAINHPGWCDLSRCDPVSEADGGEHYSRGTMWPSTADGARTTVSLMHTDDVHTLTRQDVATTHILVEVEHTEYPASIQARFTPGEARIVAAALVRYATEAEQDNRVGIRYTGAELSELVT